MMELRYLKTKRLVLIYISYKRQLSHQMEALLFVDAGNEVEVCDATNAYFIYCSPVSNFLLSYQLFSISGITSMSKSSFSSCSIGLIMPAFVGVDNSIFTSSESVLPSISIRNFALNAI